MKPDQPKVKVKFLPSGDEYDIEFNETILHMAQRNDVHIQSVCKGIPSCAECRVRVVEGEHHVLPPTSKEISLIGTAHYVDQSRLSCQLRCFGDVVVDVSEQVEKQGRVSKAPQGAASRKDGEESFAVKGNIIEDYTEFNEVDLVNEVGNLNEAGKGSFYEDVKGKGSKKKRSGNRQQRGGASKKNTKSRGPQAHKGEKSDGKSEKQGDGSGAKKRRRRRRGGRSRSSQTNQD